jgi:hypothetical protein
MQEETARNSGEIETLLATRQRISEWLHRLGQTASGVSASVRDRVRSDYQGRLAKVVEELRSHSTALSENLSGLRRELAERERVRLVEEEALAEAQLRHAVGEYAEEEWRAHEERSGTRLESLGAEIQHLTAEIGRMEEVLSQITGAPSVGAAPAAAEPEPAVAVVDDEPAMPDAAGAMGAEYQLGEETFITLDDGPSDPRTQSVFDVTSALPSAPDPAMEPIPNEVTIPEAPKFTPRGPAIPPRPRQTSRAVEDELAFLKSVTAEPTPARPAVMEKKASAASAAAVASKTLKCQDCGTLNRPTEWYCERCGAELSAV